MEARRCLLCDAMGTLVALSPPAPILRRQLADRWGILVSIEQAQAAIGAEISYYRAHMLEGRDAGTVRALQLRCAQELWAALPGTAGLDAIRPAERTEVLLGSLRFDVFADAADALRRLRVSGWRVVVVSNWDHSLASVLARTGLGPLLDGVVTSAEVGVGKPEAAIFVAALELAGVAAADAVHVGDSLEEDVAGARGAGIRAIWLNRNRLQGPAGVSEIAGLDALAAQLCP